MDSMGIILRFLAAYPEVPLAIASFFVLGFLRHKDTIIQLPIAGMVPSILLNLHRVHDWTTKVLEEKGCTILVKGPILSGMDFVFSSDPSVAKYVTSTKFQNFIRGPQFREILEVLGEGIMSSESEEWMVRRRLTKDLMHQPKFLQSVHMVTQHMLERRLLPLLAHLSRPCVEKNVVDMQDVFQRFTFDLTCSLIYGVDLGCLSETFPAVPFAIAIKDMEEAVTFRYAVPPSWWRLLRWLNIGPERKMAAGTSVIDELISQLIATKREQVSKNSDKIQDGVFVAPSDLLEGFIKKQMVGEDCGSMGTEKFLRDSTFELLVAGWQTSSVAMAWLLWLVYTNPSVETKILNELVSTQNADELGRREQKNGYVVFDARKLDGCVYLNAAILESLRLFAPVPLIPKYAAQQEVLPTGQKLKPGTMVLLSLYAMGRMEKTWGKDAREFKPERWITEDGKLREESSYKFAVFSSGPRICLGKSQALGTISAVAALVLYNFQFNVAEGLLACPRSSAILHMKNGLKGSLRDRFPR